MLSVKNHTLVRTTNGPNIPIVTNNANGSHYCLLQVSVLQQLPYDYYAAYNNILRQTFGPRRPP